MTAECQLIIFVTSVSCDSRHSEEGRHKGPPKVGAAPPWLWQRALSFVSSLLDSSSAPYLIWMDRRNLLASACDTQRLPATNTSSTFDDFSSNKSEQVSESIAIIGDLMQHDGLLFTSQVIFQFKVWNTDKKTGECKLPSVQCTEADEKMKSL